MGIALVLTLVWASYTAAQYGFKRYYRAAYPLKYAEYIDAACEKYKLDRAIVYALVRTESGFDEQAVSNVGARGLMQLMPDALDWVRMRKGEKGDANYSVLFNPQKNIEYGTHMLKLLYDEFNTTDNVLCAYHAGWGSVKSWLDNPLYSSDGRNIEKIPYSDTAHYVSKVNKAANIYRKLYGI